jgi:hypothetical protein
MDGSRNKRHVELWTIALIFAINGADTVVCIRISDGSLPPAVNRVSSYRVGGVPVSQMEPFGQQPRPSGADTDHRFADIQGDESAIVEGLLAMTQTLSSLAGQWSIPLNMCGDGKWFVAATFHCQCPGNRQRTKARRVVSAANRQLTGPDSLTCLDAIDPILIALDSQWSLMKGEDGNTKANYQVQGSVPRQSKQETSEEGSRWDHRWRGYKDGGVSELAFQMTSA